MFQIKDKIHYVQLLSGEVGYRKEIATNREYSFIYVGIQHLARVNGVIGGSGKKFYYHNDHLGSALAVTDEKGNKVVERDFTPFGERINTDVYDDEPRDVDEDESGFTGKDWDMDAELYYYNARWYDPAVGRFISEDSVNDPANLNVYVYCANNPVINIDPTGHILINFEILSTISKGLNLAAELDSDFEGLASSFNKFTGCLSDVKDFIMGAKQVFGQKDIKVTKDKVIVRTKDGGRKIYDKEDMKTDFQYLAALQEDKSKAGEAEKFEKIVKDEYKDYFDVVKGDNQGVTLIGLRGWGKRTPVPGTDTIKGEHPYDDMLLVLDEKGNLGAFSEVNFEGSSAKGYYYSKKLGRTVTLDGTNPAILDGVYDLHTRIHSGYDALTINDDGRVPTGPGSNPNYPERNPPYAVGVHIHKGGSDWNWSEGCITVYSKHWDRFMSYFPKDQKEHTWVGKFNLMTL